MEHTKEKKSDSKKIRKKIEELQLMISSRKSNYDYKSVFVNPKMEKDEANDQDDEENDVKTSTSKKNYEIDKRVNHFKSIFGHEVDNVEVNFENKIEIREDYNKNLNI